MATGSMPAFLARLIYFFLVLGAVKVNYINKTKIIIICKKHGEFSQKPSHHISGHNCLKCGNENSRLTQNEFIKKAKKIHGNKYDYSKVNYKNSDTKIIIICKKHGKFKQKASTHLQEANCFKCANNIPTIQEFIEKAKQIHGNKYDYSKVNYINAHTKIIIICKKHGKFLQRPNGHLSGRGCSKCSGKNLTTKEFVEKAKRIHGNKYNYFEVNYYGASKKVIIICRIHGQFLQLPSGHLIGHGCPKCSHWVSMGEIKWLDKVEEKQNIRIERNKIIYIDGKKFITDGFHKSTNTWYEYNGYFWHGHPDYYNPNDINPRTKTTFGELYQETLEKEKLIKSAGYNLVVKWED